MVVGLGAVIGGYSLGNVADELITYFDEYSDDKQEGKDKRTGEEDIFGTAAGWDLLYPYGIIAMGELLFSVITFGGYIFAFGNAGFDYPLECDTFDAMDGATRTQLQDVIEKVQDLATCQEFMPEVFRIADMDGDGMLSKCEDANLLFTTGNGKDYSKKYSHALYRS